jgi:hypothetical protein
LGNRQVLRQLSAATPPSRRPRGRQRVKQRFVAETQSSIIAGGRINIMVPHQPEFTGY